jgi:hypothetical protein
MDAGIISTIPEEWPRFDILLSTFNFLALLEVIERTFLFITDSQRVQQLIVTGFAIVRKYIKRWSGFHSLYATLGLLIPFLDPMEGTYISPKLVQADPG